MAMIMARIMVMIRVTLSHMRAVNVLSPYAPAAFAGRSPKPSCQNAVTPNEVSVLRLVGFGGV